MHYIGEDKTYEKMRELPNVSNVDFSDAYFFEAKDDENSKYHQAIQYDFAT